MKIIYFLDIPVGLGGAGNILLEQAKIMGRTHEVVMAIPCTKSGKINPEYERRCRKAGLTYVGLYYNTAFWPQYIDFMTVKDVLPEIKKFIAKEKADLLHSVQLNFAVELAARELGIPHLMNIYQLRREEFIFRHMDVFPQYHSCDSLLYCKLWSEEAGMETRCIRAAAPLERMLERKGERKKEAWSLRLLMLGTVCGFKNQMAAIQAVEICNQCHKGITLTIAGGDGSDCAQICKDYVKAHGLSDRVKIVGFLSDVEPALRMHDCLLCASTWESFPSSIVEAMTYDLTIISTPVAGVPELLTNGKNAFITSGFGADEIAAGIEQCLEAYKDGRIEEIHKYAKDTWEKNFCQKVVREKLDEYYSDILKRHSENGSSFKKKAIFFDEAVAVYEELTKAGLTEEFVLQRCYHYACLKKRLRTGKAYIWGAGKYGKAAKQLLEILFKQINLVSYIDMKKKGECLGLPVIMPDEIAQDADYIFLGFAGEKGQAIACLEQKGFRYHHSIWILP